MAKKKKFKSGKHKTRNAPPPSTPSRNTPSRNTPSRNAPTRSAPRKPHNEETPLRRLGYTAAGAAGTALAGSFLAHEGWAPKTIATALTAVGAGLAWKGDEPTIRSVGAGVMSAAGSQLALMMIDDRDKKVAAPQSVTAPEKKPANYAALPPGSLENAFNEARRELALAGSDEL
jgi:hypothetical protein